MKSRFDVLISPAAHVAHTSPHTHAKEKPRTAEVFKPAGLRYLARLAALAAVSMTFAGNVAAQEGFDRSAAETQTAKVGLAELEHSFWVCDYVATSKGVSEGLIVRCVAIYDELKERKFGGDFDGLLDWWQQNKPARHASLGALETAAADSQPLVR